MHAFVNELERPVGTYLYGRRMYDVMVAWETMKTEDQPAVIRDYAEIWRAADKIVYSTTLDTAASAKTQIERCFDPEAVRQEKAKAARDLSVGGPGLAAQALAAGLVDECHLCIVPAIVSGGTRFFPEGLRLDLELVEERRFDNGTVYLHYRTQNEAR